jgi:peptidoglycan/xylan/chitin deacetylase (PgdA/CDA1 family)
MKATFYIIDGGQESKWCIGASRRPQNCGDAYLTWDQVRELDRSGLITIGSHTVDHISLAAASEADQRFQIFEGKSELEAQLGHVVKHFAYPYGTFTATTISLVEQAGFATAVSTQPGETQTLNTIYSLHRVREIRALP